ncbi:hypothetical protein [Streptomyces sp. NBC_00198]|uniref:hypothetical protein n=1 Tax=Streptomyces sp. NBC_00198 TaxID=2975677 RepID=UPI0022537F1B|nr:hypothetical protein [Streptomyces sp. NBC_00198]MCX5285669.1 hypothetical protein [Streptomyces sp. NBC_00198]MCX5286229.1 hypothetical protein [Streptomyces sp. NBC_00198]
MTRDKKRKAAIRETARTTGRRYTAVAREMAAASAAPSFQLGALLAECASLPEVRPDWTELDHEWAPPVFESKLVGTAVPYGSVLELAGLLAREGRDAGLAVESVSPEHSAVVTCGHRRIQLLISQANAWELCRIPHCADRRYIDAFTHCTEHFSRCDAPALVRMGQEWAYERVERHDDNRAAAGGSSEVDDLVKAAVVQGCYDALAKAILDGLFGDLDLLDDLWINPDQQLAIRHAREREGARLHAVASAVVRRRQAEGRSCTGCGRHLVGWSGSRPVLRCQKCEPSQRSVDPVIGMLLKDLANADRRTP